MAVGSASQNIPGMVELNVQQAAGNYSTVPAVVLDDPTNGSQILHIGGRSAAPTVALGASVGTGGTPAISMGTGSTDFSGTISLKDGTSAWATGAQATVTFNVPFVAAPVVIVGATEAVSGAAMSVLQPYVTTTTTGFVVNFTVANSSSQKTYVFSYAVFGH